MPSGSRLTSRPRLGGVGGRRAGARGRGTAGRRRGVGHAAQCGPAHASRQAADALPTPVVCTRVRLRDACGCPDEEADTVQHANSAIQSHAGPCGVLRSRR
jgi:hypothetical protein